MSERVCTLTNHWSRCKPGYTHWHTDADTATVVVVIVIIDDDDVVVVVVVAAAVVVIVAVGGVVVVVADVVVVIVAVGVVVVLDILELYLVLTVQTDSFFLKRIISF